MSKIENKTNKLGGEKKGFGLPPTTAKPPMPKVKPPKKEK